MEPSTRRARITSLAGPVLAVAFGVILVGCGSTTAAAPITVTAAAIIKTAQPVTAPPVTVTATTIVQHTLPRVTQVSIVPKTVIKTAAPVTVNHTATVLKKAEPVTVTAQPPAAKSSFGEGTQLVGSDIQPGTYRSAGGSRCYFERLSGASGDLDDVISNDIGTTNPVVEIESSDFAFQSSDCGDWTKIG